MARPVSLGLRVRVAAGLTEGATVRAAAERFGLSVAGAVRTGQRARAGVVWQPARLAALAGRFCRAQPR